ncbi:MAG: peptidylprolyl isomerase, partial [Actinobacteria bacterium]|nr:peptidylprolyl isomerase [Actinomycetota bacterium]
MTPSLARLRALAFVLVALLALSACSKARPPAAVVDGERITDEQLASDMKLFTFLARLGRAPCGQPEQGESKESACARLTLSNLIQEDLVKHYARAHDVTVPDATVSDAIAQLETNLGGAADLEGRLKESGLTSEDLRALAARLLLFNEVQRALAEEQFTDAELRQAYEANLNQYTELHAAHILVKTKGQAERLEEQVTAKNFGELAKRYSIDPSAKQNGGDLGEVVASTFDATFVETALALEPGEISRPVRTQFGWHIIRLISADVQPFEDVRSQLLDDAAGNVFGTWLRDRLATAEITVNPKYGRLDTATGQIVPIRSTATGSPA